MADSHAVEYLDRCRGTPPGTRPMGWQVSWLAGQCSLPPSRAVAWTDISGIGQVLAAYSCGGSRGIASPRLGRRTRTTFPHRSFIRRRPSSQLVQPRARALSMAKAPARQRSACGICRACGIYCRRRGDALPWRRCQVLVQALGLASETGSWCERCIAAQSQHCPRNGERIKANIDVTAPERRGKTFAGHTGVRESGDRPGIEQRIPSRWANWVM
jgi:hypothetical protein